LTKIRLRGGFALPLILLIISCAHLHNNLINNDRYISFQKEPDNIDSIKDFKDNYVFKERDKNIIYSFEKGYLETLLGQNIIDFYVDDNLLLFFNSNFLFTNHRECPTIELKKRYNKLAYNNGYISLSSQNIIDLFSLKYCGQLSFQLKKKLSHSLLFYPFIIFYDRNNILIEKISDGKEYFSIEIVGEILKIRQLDNRVISVICTNGNLINFDIFKKCVINVIDLNTTFINVDILDGILYFLDRDGYFKVYDTKFDGNKVLLTMESNRKIPNPYGSLLAKHYPAIITKEFLVVGNKLVQPFNYLDDISFDIFDKDKCIYLKEGNLSVIYIDKMRFIRKVTFGSVDKSGCLVNNSIIFKDLDNNYKIMNINTGEQKKYYNPGFRCDSPIHLKKGYFYLNGKILKFADIVKSSKNYTLLMRKIDNTYYFYVE
jgi:hypothetical protein